MFANQSPSLTISLATFSTQRTPHRRLPKMKFLAVAAVAVLAAIAEAKASFTNTAYNVEAGEPFTLTWAGNTGPVTITLKNGPEDDLKTVTVIDCKSPQTRMR